MKMMTPDTELLRRFDRTNAEDAFAELVKRHVNLVFSAALRQVHGDEHLAKDVAQTVFSDLARKAGSLARRESLTGWLYTSAHHAAAKIIRSETRRRDREEKFMRESEGSGTGVPPVQSANELAEWENLRPMLDAAMHELREADREAILLRYFENRPFADVGAKLGLNENAARMRVERALERLRAVFAKRGIAATSALAAVISANAVQFAPVGFSATLTTAAITTAGTGAFTLMKIMTMTNLKLGVSALVVAGTATALVVQQQNQTKLRDENGVLQQQVAQLRTDNESFSNRLAAAGDVKKLPDDQFNELLKLRGEVGVLRRQNESQKAQISQNEAIRKNTQFIGHTPGTYISKEQLSDAGYATPETALETINWAMMSGTYDQVNQGLSPELLADEFKNPNGREDFEKQQKMIAPLFKGMQIVAAKSLADDRVELKFKMDADPVPGQANQQPSFLIQPMVKVGNEWKLGGSTRSYSDNWENNGQVQTFVP